MALAIIQRAAALGAPEALGVAVEPCVAHLSCIASRTEPVARQVCEPQMLVPKHTARHMAVVVLLLPLQPTPVPHLPINPPRQV